MAPYSIRVVGDPVQSSWPDPDEAAVARDRVLGPAARRQKFTLRTNYRNSIEIFDLATSALGDSVSASDLPVAVRSTGIKPEQLVVTDLTAATVAATSTSSVKPAPVNLCCCSY